MIGYFAYENHISYLENFWNNIDEKIYLEKLYDVLKQNTNILLFENINTTLNSAILYHNIFCLPLSDKKKFDIACFQNGLKPRLLKIKRKYDVNYDINKNYYLRSNSHCLLCQSQH